MQLSGSLRSPLVADLALVVTWSSGFIGAELSSRAGADPITLLAWRFLLLAVLLVGVYRALGNPWPSRSSWRRQSVVGVLCQPAYLLLVFEGVAHGVPGGTAALIAALQPLLVATVAGRLLGEPTTRLMWVGMVLGLVGVAIVVSGDLAVVGSAAVGLPAADGRHAVPDDRHRARPAPRTVRGGAPDDHDAVGHHRRRCSWCWRWPSAGRPSRRRADFWWAVLWLIVLASLGGYVMYVHVARTQGATVVSTLLYLTPPTTMLWAYLMFGMPLTLVAVAGLAVSAVGVALVLRVDGARTRSDRRRRDRRSAAQRLPRSG